MTRPQIRSDNEHGDTRRVCVYGRNCGRDAIPDAPWGMGFCEEHMNTAVAAIKESAKRGDARRKTSLKELNKNSVRQERSQRLAIAKENYAKLSPAHHSGRCCIHGHPWDTNHMIKQSIEYGCKSCAVEYAYRQILKDTGGQAA